MVFSIYVIPETIMISSTNFTELKYFQELIYNRVIIQKSAFEIFYDYSIFLVMPF